MPTCNLTSSTNADLVKHQAIKILTCREFHPCYYFDHATFADVTKFLVYSTLGHPEEHVSEEFGAEEPLNEQQTKRGSISEPTEETMLR